MRRVYASLPLSGPAAGPGREVLRGAELALEAAKGPTARLVALDSFADDRERRAAANARRAIEDAGTRPRLDPWSLPIDGEGHTTTTAYGRLAVVDGELVWDDRAGA